MNTKLNDEDRRAVDLLLDRATSDGNAGNGINGGLFAAPPASLSQRVHSAERLLQLLDFLPAAEPPQGLSLRTVRRVEEIQAAEQAGVQAPAHPYAAPRPLYER